MANTTNVCKDLEINTNLHKDAIDHNHDTLGDVYYHQKDLQEKTYGFDFDNMTLNEIKDFWLVNNHAVSDEINEMMDALGGINDGDASAVWKYWKSAHNGYKNKKISDLSDSDLKELKMEWIDILHFMLNYAISIGFKPEEIYNYYFSKAAENKSRQNRGY